MLAAPVGAMEWRWAIFRSPSGAKVCCWAANRLAPPANLPLSLRDVFAVRQSRGRGAKQLPSHREAEMQRVLELRFSSALVRPSKA